MRLSVCLLALGCVLLASPFAHAAEDDTRDLASLKHSLTSLLDTDDLESLKFALSSLVENTAEQHSTALTVESTRAKFKLPGPQRHHLKIVLAVLKELGWTETTEGDWELLWAFRYVFGEENEVSYKKARGELKAIRPWQRVNHWPEIGYLVTKHLIGRCLGNRREERGEEYAILPRTFSLPEQMDELKLAYESTPPTTHPTGIQWLIKDKMHRGVVALNSLADVESTESEIVQEYVHSHLVDGYKLDVALYIVITSLYPTMRAFVFDDALIRVCKHKYPTTKATFFEDLESWVIKDYNALVTVPTLKEHYTGNNMETMDLYYRSVDPVKGAQVFPKLFEIARKTLLSSLPNLQNGSEKQASSTEGKSVGTSFEMIRMDFLVDEELEPWLMEANMSPNLAAKNDADGLMKKTLLTNLYKMMDMDRRTPEEIAKTQEEPTVNHRVGQKEKEGESCAERTCLWDCPAECLNNSKNFGYSDIGVKNPEKAAEFGLQLSEEEEHANLLTEWGRKGNHFGLLLPTLDPTYQAPFAPDTFEYCPVVKYNHKTVKKPDRAPKKKASSESILEQVTSESILEQLNVPQWSSLDLLIFALGAYVLNVMRMKFMKKRATVSDAKKSE